MGLNMCGPQASLGRDSPPPSLCQLCQAVFILPIKGDADEQALQSELWGFNS